jgi:anti-sigma regulatory factor (Ser/Thr protein kinase)
LELVRILKKDYPHIPVVLIASQGSHDIALRALHEGAVYYSPKSALGRDLVPAVRQVLGISDHLQAAHERESTPVECAVSFELENDDCLIYGLIEHLQVNLPEWADADRIQIAMALHEAVTNAMHHGNLEVSSELRNECESKYYETIQTRRTVVPYCDRRVRIDAQYQPHEVTFRVIDQGPGFDPLSVCDPRASNNLERLSGRGLLLIRSFMDDVRHNASGNQITMIKRNRLDVALA